MHYLIMHCFGVSQCAWRCSCFKCSDVLLRCLIFTFIFVIFIAIIVFQRAFLLLWRKVDWLIDWLNDDWLNDWCLLVKFAVYLQVMSIINEDRTRRSAIAEEASCITVRVRVQIRGWVGVCIWIRSIRPLFTSTRTWMRTRAATRTINGAPQFGILSYFLLSGIPALKNLNCIFW